MRTTFITILSAVTLLASHTAFAGDAAAGKAKAAICAACHGANGIATMPASFCLSKSGGAK